MGDPDQECNTSKPGTGSTIPHRSDRKKKNDLAHRRIFLGNVSFSSTNESLGEFFQQFGKVIESVAIIDQETGQPKGFGFVTFSAPEEAQRALSNPNPIVDNRRLHCNLASLRPKPQYQHLQFAETNQLMAAPMQPPYQIQPQVVPVPLQAHTPQVPMYATPIGLPASPEQGTYTHPLSQYPAGMAPMMPCLPPLDEAQSTATSHMPPAMVPMQHAALHHPVYPMYSPVRILVPSEGGWVEQSVQPAGSEAVLNSVWMPAFTQGGLERMQHSQRSQRQTLPNRNRRRKSRGGRREAVQNPGDMDVANRVQVDTEREEHSPRSDSDRSTTHVLAPPGAQAAMDEKPLSNEGKYDHSLKENVSVGDELSVSSPKGRLPLGPAFNAQVSK